MVCSWVVLTGCGERWYPSVGRGTVGLDGWESGCVADDGRVIRDEDDL